MKEFFQQLEQEEQERSSDLAYLTSLQVDVEEELRSERREHARLRAIRNIRK